jgi:L-alanine-DL-glutamate epimerase-like enolase superfamily enzyme
MQIDVQLMASTPHGLMMEHLPWISSLFERPVRIERGYALVPHEPGAGTDISAEAIAKYSI